MAPFSTTTVAAALLAAAIGASARTFTVRNNCAYTVWPAVFTDLNVHNAVPAIESGWEAPPGNQRSFFVPDDWKAGRIWARKDCHFNTGSGPNSCGTGSCIGNGLGCDARLGTGVPPASLAEWTLSAGGDADWYDVSLVDGFNVPMRISNNVGCAVAECAKDLVPDCPAALRGAHGGCRSACEANLDGNQGNSGNCCSGSHNTPATCPPGGVAFYNYFKSGCPRSYVYAYDESSGTALFTCPSNKRADYTLTFCP